MLEKCFPMGLITVALGRPLQVKIAEPLLWGLCFPGLRSEASVFFKLTG